MGAALVFSIAPVWVEAIANGKKKVELRRRAPILKESVQAIIYETSPKKQVRLVCLAGPTIKMPVQKLWAEFGSSAEIDKAGFDRYFGGCSHGYGVKLSQVECLGRPIGLAHLREFVGFSPPQSWCYASEELMKLVMSRI